MSFVQKILIGSLRTGQNIWPDWFTFHQSRYYVSMAYRPVYEETCDVNIKIAQTTQSIWILLSESQGYWRKGNPLAIIQEIRSKNWSLLIPSWMHCNKSFVKNCPDCNIHCSKWFCLALFSLQLTFNESRCTDCCINMLRWDFSFQAKGSYIGHILYHLSCRT